MKLFVNTRKLLSEKTEEGVRDALGTIADYAVAVSPVDTGAYIQSFSIAPLGSGGGRSVSSDNLPRNQDKGSKAAAGRAELEGDIQGLDIRSGLKRGNLKLVLRNRAPHAINVENGANWQRDGYHVFTKIRSRFR